ncbi:MAG: carboxypeptidase regulatory-like domain-containing protein [Kofleriaceae bacterium]|nr:carboxypeptidase regulatory-like domain-containing protein [Myxococcales bacterium]MCB9562344.1 carboxypeptidase regulatory-like domain-containing protein [Kofleriaceae bacterium]MCB9572049.1 carboxypeptidase regulatory-like domain-containing protein [Kofleriaceae bacterium]MCB9574759.1 carboxypeptidase regulatory-like domain-containing protein [Kofleriaceae bacterium]
MRATLAASAFCAVAAATLFARDTFGAPAGLHAPALRDALAPVPERLAAAAAATQVVGQVLDRCGVGVEGATVIARPVAVPVTTLGVAARTFQVITDPAGRFQLAGMPPGTYWFIALHGADAVGSSPPLPVIDHIEVAIRLDDAPVNA